MRSELEADSITDLELDQTRLFPACHPPTP
jgi:hypothetical protein